ncbi:hypothetical protein DYE48_03400 [Halobacillus trueperi]|uniref:Uncharacterized protein n=1 Tax=Halobacillus trueperi TaxID=156205 RepID=A0A3E0JCN7_9BACI|nr:hypothetical protein DYE48_03400 [Halobacillus trueperi]
MEWGGWEAARLPWEKETGEIPQGAARGSSALPHRKASSFSATPDAQKKQTNPGYLETESSRKGNYCGIVVRILLGVLLVASCREVVMYNRI